MGINMQSLKNKRVAVFGVGGVGGYAADALARNGVGTIDVFDNDTVALTNLNRQIIALNSTVGRVKVDVMAEHIARIAPETVVNRHCCFYMPDNADEYDLSVYDYIIDAIDTVKGKLEIITRAKALGVPVISCMGAGNKLDAAAFEVADIYETTVCPLAKTMRHELRRRGIASLRVVYSKEVPIKPIASEDTDAERVGTSRRATPGSTAFAPAVAGLLAAGEAIKNMCNNNVM
ncbi:MAG: tRNA threonylcarbamoyladenosine dehydratase [Clostridia bacterium]|nr:tRNA threonylcarbamoyladenosine dehydratase [Clostridia bacterium]